MGRPGLHIEPSCWYRMPTSHYCFSLVGQLQKSKMRFQSTRLRTTTEKSVHGPINSPHEQIKQAVQRKIGALAWSGRPALGDSGGADPAWLEAWPGRALLDRGGETLSWGAVRAPRGLPARLDLLGWLVCCRDGGGPGLGPPGCPELLVTRAGRGRTGGPRRGADPSRRTGRGSGASGSEPWSVRQLAQRGQRRGEEWSGSAARGTSGGAWTGAPVRARPVVESPQSR
ncbi:hypothetical protein NDU88_006189 [Pleurodeles waltl]|uniref:Uncharacterized protein n=1 Tax=Pleurodeles waltl TaxID=8319 RepID=A0AAV7UN86_PLEWA|nr:hypothetical protein NDU88_006189 [Pleurodeles waltl]